MPIKVRLPRLDDWKAQVKCQSGCPVATDAGRYVQLIADRRDEDAYLVARAPNPFASVCGRVCAAPCEDACRRGSIDAPISIRALKRFVTEQCGVESIRPDTQDRLRERGVTEGNRYAGHLPVTDSGTGPSAATKRKVAVIGAGPAGMSAAHDLALRGYDVTVFESASEPGGMMRFGIPEYRLPRSIIRAEIDKILALGVTLHVDTPLTSSYGLAELRRAGGVERHEAAADDHDAPAKVEAIAAVDVQQVVDGLHDAVELDARHLEVAAGPDADREKHRLEAFAAQFGQAE